MLKLMMGLLTLALLIAAMRRVAEGLRHVAVPVRPTRRARPAAGRLTRLRQDPRTGIYYPEG